MGKMRHVSLWLVIALSALAAGCATPPVNTANSGSPSPVASPDASKDSPVTLAVLDALFADGAFKSQLKAKLELTDDQLAQLQKIAGEEVARLRKSNVEAQSHEQTLEAEQSRERAAEAIRGVIGAQKAEGLFALAREYWVTGSTAQSSTAEVAPETLPTVPNFVPTDTRIVVNIPAYRMDVFKDGSLVKSYKVGIGYPAFPLPTGVRKAQTIIFNPTWTPPDEPWVAGMKSVRAGQAVAAGSSLNPLGPIKIPIGSPSLIHGGKSPAKIGTFASHGCVGLTNAQVQDFAKVLAESADTELTDRTIQSYLKNRTRTQVVKLQQVIPVELRYETIVVEDGELHIYRDVYNQDTNTEANLRAVLEANGTTLEDLDEEERAQVLEAVNAMSRHPLKQNAKGKANTNRSDAANSSASPTAATNDRKTEAAIRKPVTKNQKEVVIELRALQGKGYPAAVKLDTGTGKPPALAVATPVQ